MTQHSQKLMTQEVIMSQFWRLKRAEERKALRRYLRLLGSGAALFRLDSMRELSPNALRQWCASFWLP